MAPVLHYANLLPSEQPSRVHVERDAKNPFHTKSLAFPHDSLYFDKNSSSVGAAHIHQHHNSHSPIKEMTRTYRKESHCLYSTSQRFPSLLVRSRHPGQPRVPDLRYKSAAWESALRRVHRTKQGGYRAPRRAQGEAGTPRLSSKGLQ